ncbi:MAG: AMP-binding protein [Deltaproteobacteria bacterium]|nr:AMP-binding protein [Candidatus Zymogenaceae bacterium]
MKKEQKFWKKSWDKGLDDLDPALWEMSFIDAIRPTFEQFPEKPALIYMGTVITFGELDVLANRFADMLIKNGFKKGDVVGINLPNIPEYVIAWLGSLRAGCAVSGVSPLLSTEEMEYQLKDSDARGLVTLDAIFQARLTKIAPNLPKLKVVVAASIGGYLPTVKRVLGKLLKKFPTGKVTPLSDKTVYLMEEVTKPGAFSDKDPGLDITPDDIAHLQYTGGTTGPPKGAMLTHRNAVSNLIVYQTWLGWKKGEGPAISGYPYFHIAGLYVNMNGMYLAWTQILVPNPRDTKYITSQIKKYRPTTLVNVPSLYQLLMADPDFRNLDHSNITSCLSSAAPFPEESQKELEAIVGKGKLVEAYGMSETSPLIASNPYKGKRKLGSIGVPILNTDVKLVDPATGKEVGIGEPGEICVKGPQVMVGYYKKPEETKNAIDKDGYMHTGDVAIMDDEGYLKIVDRTKDMIIVGGFKVFSVKVEDVLSEHPAVDLIATIGLPNPERPGSEIVKAFIQLKPEYVEKDSDALKEDITTYARERLTPYETPKVIEFLDEIPLTAVGKINKKVLRPQ